MVTSVNNLTNNKYIQVALLVKKLRLISQSYTKQSASKLLKIRPVIDLIVA